MVNKQLRPIMLQGLLYVILWYDNGHVIKWLVRLITITLITS